MQDDVNLKPVIENGVYAIYDSKLCQFELPLVMPVNTAVRELKNIVNSYGTKYFFSPEDFILYRIGTYENSTAKFELLPVGQYLVLCNLQDLVDKDLRRKFMLLHTLNTLPVGYYKMPSEMKEDIQKNIDNACQAYVKDFIIPEIENGNLVVNSDIQNPRPVGGDTDNINDSEVSNEIL